MAQLIPKIPVESIDPPAERVVIKALLKQLPDECVVLHSYETLVREQERGRDGQVHLKEGETDAVVLWPGKGMLVIEVKGGEVTADGCKERCTENASTNHVSSLEDAFEQVRSNMHTLLGFLTKAANVSKEDQLGITFGYAVVMPNDRIEGKLPNMCDPAVLIAQGDMYKIGAKVEDALSLWRRKNNNTHCQLSMKQVRNALLPTFKVVPSLRARIEGEAAEFFRLTAEQSRYLDFASQIPQARIQGVAGSGKTLLAMEQATRFDESGMKTLLLCYNTALAQTIRSACSEESQVDVLTFHELCEKATLAAGFPFIVPDDKSAIGDFYVKVAPELLLEHVDSLGDRYQAIVVDEGQDFHAHWWEVLQLCTADDARMFVFYDPQQDIFKTGGIEKLDHLPTFPLKINCRNTRAISTYCGEIFSLPDSAEPNHISGVPVKTAVVPEAAKRQMLVENLVSNWIKKDRIEPSQIDILSPYRKERTCVSDVEKIGNTTLVTDFGQWQKNQGVLVSTIRAFKGHEASIVLMIDLPTPNTRPVFSKSDWYVGASRACNVLHVVAVEALDEQLAA